MEDKLPIAEIITIKNPNVIRGKIKDEEIGPVAGGTYLHGAALKDTIIY